MKPVMYIIANKGLDMSPGKLAAQVAHAAVEAYCSSDPSLCDEWWKQGHAKIVLEARDTEHMMLAEKFIKTKGIDVYPIIDEGRTEIAAHSYTALASEVVDKAAENVKSAFEDFKTYKAEKPAKVTRCIICKGTGKLRHWSGTYPCNKCGGFGQFTVG